MGFSEAGSLWPGSGDVFSTRWVYLPSTLCEDCVFEDSRKNTGQQTKNSTGMLSHYGKRINTERNGDDS